MSELTTAEVSLSARRAALQNAITQYLGKGYRVVSQTDTTAQMVKPKKKLSFIILILLGLTGVGLFYIAWVLTRKEQSVYLVVDETGRVQETHG